MKRTFLSLIAMAAAAAPQGSAQTLSIGLIGGAGLTDAVRDRTSYDQYSSLGSRVWSQSKDWVAGATFEFQFRSPLSIEVDGMYRLLHMTWATVLPDGTLNSVSPSPVVTWEFPVLAKYRFHVEKWRPFVEAGPAFRTTGNLNFTPSHFGAAAGAGVEASWHGWTVAPTIRYTRWASDLNRYGRGSTSQLNQLELLMAVTRQADSVWRPAGGRVSLGAVLGWGLNPDLRPSQFTVNFDFPPVSMTSNSRGVTSLIAGPKIEVHLGQRWSVELDALHKPLRGHTDLNYSNGWHASSTGTEATLWQFPVLAKYRIAPWKFAPFVEAGPSFRLPQWNLATHGVTGGAGVAVRLRALEIAPALRFTHWGADSGYRSGVRSNEAAVLVGFALRGPGR